MLLFDVRLEMYRLERAISERSYFTEYVFKELNDAYDRACRLHDDARSWQDWSDQESW